LFIWNAVEQHLDVTWDSSRPNSYFYQRIPTVLSKADNFAFSFDVTLSTIEIGVNPGKPFTFQLAAGFLNFLDATRTNFLRGAGVNPANGPRNAVEFDYFPDSGFGATIAPTIISSNNQFATSFSFPLELTEGPRFHVSLSYSASDQTLRTTMTRDDQPFGPIKDVILPASFSDFRVDTFAIISYSDDGADGSIRARGMIDNLVAEFPNAPLDRIAGAFVDNRWQVRFATQTNWLYTLELSEDLRVWTRIGEARVGNDSVLTLNDEGEAAQSAGQRFQSDRETGKGSRSPQRLRVPPTPRTANRFYRVRAERL
jgi:hypothetical protein